MWNKLEDGKNYIIMAKIATEKAGKVENLCTGRGSADTMNSGGANQHMTSGQEY